MQVWFNGRTPAFQASDEGSIPFTCLTERSPVNTRETAKTLGFLYVWNITEGYKNTSKLYFFEQKFAQNLCRNCAKNDEGFIPFTCSLNLRSISEVFLYPTIQV